MTKNQLEYMRLQEERRHNLESEGVSKGELGVHQGTLGESVRHNTVSEALSARDIASKERGLAETVRHNVAGEKIDQARAYLEGFKLDETVRHNRETEGQGRIKTVTGGLNDIGSFYKNLAPVITVAGKLGNDSTYKYVSPAFD